MVSAIFHRLDKNCRLRTKVTVFGIKTAVLRINHRLKGDISFALFSAIFHRWEKIAVLGRELPFLGHKLPFGG